MLIRVLAAERRHPAVLPLDVTVPRPPYALQPGCTRAMVPGKPEQASPVSFVTLLPASAAARRWAVR
ncbi:MAG TPA: hypothetical protein VLW50_24070 [Streptosporangiaceae bacterium]|nr:hypothetical protein [Streptosporangiaceae bacterium]